VGVKWYIRSESTFLLRRQSDLVAFAKHASSRRRRSLWRPTRCRLTDADLLRGAQRGDAEAWRTLYQRYLPFVWRQAYAAVGNSHTAEDITSDTMLALLRGIARLDADVPKLAGWLRTVVRHKAMDHHRQPRVRENVNGQSDAAEIGAVAAEPAQSLEIDELRSQVLRALEGVADKHRIILEWKYLDGLDVHEISQRLGQTAKAVESDLYRARQSFRRRFERLEKNGENSSPLRADSPRDAVS
jgi:RNA polymerase sigma-70 factor (ECF subfamily)